jgi:predicted glycoside hydrolase/deacetylase ChbG (UPF0249 family)
MILTLFMALSLPAALVHAQPVVERSQPATPRKMIVRADDVGATDVYNLGVFEAIDNGVVTWADIMLDTPGSVDALRKLKARPWISVGWHTHMWGTPLLAASEVPSLVVPQDQEFAGRFRTDLQTAQDVVYEEILAELRAQMRLSIRYMGRPPTFAPSRFGPVNTDTPFMRARQKVVEEFGMIDGWYNGMGKVPADPKYASRKIWYTDMIPGVKDFYLSDSVVEWETKYSPANYYLQDRGGNLKLMDEGWVTVRAWHPGYLDLWTYLSMERGDRTMSRRFTLPRLLDLEGLTSRRLKQWIIDNRITLVSPHDALFNQNIYQEHLKRTGSDLYMPVLPVDRP